MAAFTAASQVALKAVRRLLRTELVRLQEVDHSLAARLARVETEIRAVQQAQAGRLESLESEVRTLRERVPARDPGSGAGPR